MRDQRDPEAIGLFIRELRKQMPKTPLSQVYDIAVDSGVDIESLGIALKELPGARSVNGNKPH